MPYLLILPGFIFYGLFVLVPIADTVRLSFLEWDGLSPQVFVGLDNYVQVLTNPNTWTSLRVSLVFVLFSCLLPVAAALLLVGVIARTKIRGLSFFRFVFFLPYTIALAVVAIAWRWLYAQDGSLNAIIRAVFGEEFVRPFLGDADLALPALGIVGLWATFGFVVVMLLSGTQHIQKELYEAARMDGAGPVREFFTVTLPGIRHELRVSLVMTLTLALRVFDLPLMATQGGPGYATTTPSLQMYRDVFINGQIGPGAAIAVLLTIVIFVGVALVNRLVRSE
ncbi:carbohydrate ABC transporter permease [Nonomuraea terrae]|uniref:carbohydrate ABC transporter permease n=1 Tax=Nonomuraea terrae TaxID=2530383 RepID=UPI00379FD5D3